MFVKLIAIFLISTSAIASEEKSTNLYFKKPIYKIEYDPKTDKIKVLSKKDPTKECDKQLTREDSKELIRRSVKSKDKKTIMNFSCPGDY